MSIRMRHTSSHTKNRRSHHALKNKNIVTDKESGAKRMPHRLDETTGMYRGKLIVTPKAKKDKKLKGDQAMGPAEGHVHMEEEKPAGDKQKKGLMGRMVQSRPKARSGMGGGA